MVFVLLPLFVMLSCESQPAVENPPEDKPVPVQVQTVEDDFFDPGTITQEIFDSTKVDVQKFIGDLNQIIRAGNYNAWVSHLGDSYFAEKSSPEYLAQISEQPRLKSRRIVLLSPEDYFTHVVVPSRANDHVDDIEFVSQNRVKAYTITPNGQRLRLYDLENIGGSWKIIN
jgi:hypothetical protein